MPADAKLGDDAIVALHRLRIDLRLLMVVFRQAVVPLHNLDFDRAVMATQPMDRLSRALLQDCARVVSAIHEQEVVADVLMWRSPEQWCMLASFVLLVVVATGAARRRQADGFGFCPKLN